MYVCICNQVTASEITQACESGQCQSYDDLQTQLGVAGCCGQCKDTACALLTTIKKAIKVPIRQEEELA